MVLTEVADAPPICWFRVDMGTSAWSSSLVALEDEPADVRRPTTSSGTPLMLTVWPSGLLCPNSLLAVVGPSTVTSATLFSSAAVRNRPSARDRARIFSQVGVVPTTVVVQLAVPAV